jgi:hypothetical protein
MRVSRPFVVKMLDGGGLRGRKVGEHRRLLLRDALAFRVAQTNAIRNKSAIHRQPLIPTESDNLVVVVLEPGLSRVAAIRPGPDTGGSPPAREGNPRGG